MKYAFKSIISNNVSINSFNKMVVLKSYFLLKHLNFQFKCFIDLLTVDYPFNKNRFLTIYNILSINYNVRVFLKVWVPITLKLQSIIRVYYNAEWYERESWDMFGVFYKKSNDLRRILNDYNFKGFPLRKDFPLNGFFELKYYFKYKSLYYEKITLIQEYRAFKTISPWDYLK